jgi:hypothetical protein
MRGASQTPSIHNFKHSKGFNCHYTFGTGTVSEAVIKAMLEAQTRGM